MITLEEKQFLQSIIEEKEGLLSEWENLTDDEKKAHEARFKLLTKFERDTVFVDMDCAVSEFIDYAITLEKQDVKTLKEETFNDVMVMDSMGLEFKFCSNRIASLKALFNLEPIPYEREKYYYLGLLDGEAGLRAKHLKEHEFAE